MKYRIIAEGYYDGEGAQMLQLPCIVEDENGPYEWAKAYETFCEIWRDIYETRIEEEDCESGHDSIAEILDPQEWQRV